MAEDGGGIVEQIAAQFGLIPIAQAEAMMGELQEALAERDAHIGELTAMLEMMGPGEGEEGGLDPGFFRGDPNGGEDVDPGFYQGDPNGGDAIDPGFSRPMSAFG